MSMRPVASHGRAFAALSCGLLLTLLTAARNDALGQAKPNRTASPPAAPSTIRSQQAKATTDAVTSAPLTGTGEQMRVLAAVCASWEKSRKSKTYHGGKHDSSDIRDYHFELSREGATYKVKLWPKKPVITQIPTPTGVYQQNESSTFFYEVRRSDFKIVGEAAIM